MTYEEEFLPDDNIYCVKITGPFDTEQIVIRTKETRIEERQLKLVPTAHVLPADAVVVRTITEDTWRNAGAVFRTFNGRDSTVEWLRSELK
jgi:hypothetical protein